MFRTFAWLAAILSALWLTAASALGLGEIDVKSRLNQKFLAVIPLTSIASDDAEGALVGLASNEEFARAGMERSAYLSTLMFSVKSENGESHIVISSPQMAREPFLSFLVEVRARSGRVLREYSVLLDPADFGGPAKAAQAKPATAAASSQFFETPEEAASRAAATPAASAPAAPAATAPSTQMAPPPSAAVAPSGDGSTYGPVAARETLWSIATKVRPSPSIAMDQVLLALYEKNPKAFEGYPSLLSGAMLMVPTADEMRSTSPAAAKQRIAELPRTGGASAPRAPRVHKPRATPPTEITPQIIPPPEEKPAKPAKKPAPSVIPPPAPKVEITPPAPVVTTPPPEKKPEHAAGPPPAAPPASIIPPPVSKPQHQPEAPVTQPAPTPPPAQTTAPAPAAKPAPAPIPTPTPAPAESITAAPPAATATTSPAPSAEAATPPVAAAPPPAEEAPPHVTPPLVLEPPASVDDEGKPLVKNLLTGLAILLVLGGIGFGAFMGWKKLQERKAAAANAPAATAAAPPPKVPRPPKNMMPPPAPPAKTQLQQLEETVIDSPQLNAAAAAMEEPGARTRPGDSSMAVTAQSPDFNATHTMDEPFSLPSVTPTSKPSERVDFDVTSQFAESTMSINLDANDPVSEADFHLAYGLYDEAALLLKQAAEKDPKRTELRVKLAETYFAASRPQEFLEVATGLKNEMPTAEWQKLAIMGRQLCPDAGIFKGADESAAMGDAVDLSFDDPSEPAPVAAPAPRPASKPSAPAAGLDFKLEELELSQLEPTRMVPRDVAEEADSGALDFKLEDIELTPSTEAGSEMGREAPASNTIDFDSTSIAQAAPPPPPPPAVSQMSKTGGFNPNDTGGFNPTSTDNFEELSTSTAVMTDGGFAKARGNEVSLEDFDLGDDSAAISSGDEAGTKLDLARAYADMGDNDMAKTLLKEVVDSGNAEQKKEAQALIGRLG